VGSDTRAPAIGRRQDRLMRTLDDAIDRFAYHPATPGPDGTGVRHSALRDLLMDTVRAAWPLIPDGPDKTRAFHALHEFGTVGHLAIALTAPADLSATRSVARVLPTPAPAGPYGVLPLPVTYVTPPGAPLLEGGAGHLTAAEQAATVE
jgi:hypothetical protein